MSKHRYKVGQSVELVAGGLRNGAPDGRYRIVFAQPSEGVSLRYRVKSDKENCERTFEESQLRLLEL